jgi:hypothetical protein
MLSNTRALSIHQSSSCLLAVCIVCFLLRERSQNVISCVHDDPTTTDRIYCEISLFLIKRCVRYLLLRHFPICLLHQKILLPRDECVFGFNHTGLMSTENLSALVVAIVITRKCLQNKGCKRVFQEARAPL